MKNVFTKHPHSVGESYFQHLRFASCFGFSMILGGLACVLHAIFPFLFKQTGSNVLLNLITNFVTRVPVVEERVAALGKLITQKQNSHLHDENLG